MFAIQRKTFNQPKNTSNKDIEDSNSAKAKE